MKQLILYDQRKDICAHNSFLIEVTGTKFILIHERKWYKDEDFCSKSFLIEK